MTPEEQAAEVLAALVDAMCPAMGDDCTLDELRAYAARLMPVLREAERRGAEEAWEACAKEAHALGWLHDYDWALSDLLARNSYRVTSSSGDQGSEPR